MDKYLIKKEAIEKMEGLSKTHFLNDDARRINKSLGDLTGLTGIGFHMIDIPPGADSTELHAHQYEDECVYVLKGMGEATVGEDIFPVAAGDFLGYRAGGLAHKLTNTGAQILTCIVVGQRLEHDVADYPRLKKRLYRNEGQPWEMVSHESIEKPGGSAGKKS